LDPLFAELAKHLSDTDLTAVRDILDEIQQRTVRFRERSKTNKYPSGCPANFSLLISAR
jgi:hypothetical protein